MMKIDKDNIDVWLYDYAENLLDEPSRKEVEAFLDANAQYKQVLAQYDSKLTIPKSNIVFENKKELISQIKNQNKNIVLNKKKKFIYKKSVRICAMLLVIFIISFYVTTSLLFDESVKNNSTPIVKNNLNITKDKSLTNANQTVTEETQKHNGNNQQLFLQNKQSKTVAENTNDKVKNTNEIIEKELDNNSQLLVVSNQNSDSENVTVKNVKNTNEVSEKQDYTTIYIVVTSYKKPQSEQTKNESNNFKDKLTNTYTSLAGKITHYSDDFVQVTNDIKQKIKLNKIINF